MRAVLSARKTFLGSLCEVARGGVTVFGVAAMLRSSCLGDNHAKLASWWTSTRICSLFMSTVLVAGRIRRSFTRWPVHPQETKTPLPHDGWVKSTVGRAARGEIEFCVVSEIGDAEATYESIAGGGAFSYDHTHEPFPPDAHVSEGRCEGKWKWGMVYLFAADGAASATIEMIGRQRAVSWLTIRSFGYSICHTL